MRRKSAPCRQVFEHQSILSITNLVVHIQLMVVRQYTIVANSPRFTTTFLAYYLSHAAAPWAVYCQTF